MYHISPTQDEISAADANGVTPNLPINIVRSVEFVTKKGNIAKIEYPNFYKSSATSVEEMRAWLKSESDRQWNAIVQKENQTSQTEDEAKIATDVLLAKDLQPTFDWNNFISDELITQIIQAKNWLQPDVTKKYQNSVESLLSYSHAPRDGKIFEKIPDISAKTDTMYDIAYLGLSSITPTGEGKNDQIASIQGDYTSKLSAIHGLNISEQ